jgi:hypothetical protein
VNRLGATSIAVALVATAALASAPAVAAPGDRAGVYSVWAGGPPSAVSIAPGFPNATVSSDDPSLSVASTATLTAASPPGALFGTSSGYQHLSFSPRSLGGGAWASTSTTLTFESPTPTYGWAFILGDIDSEIVIVTASGPDGPVSGAELGFVSAFDLTAPEVIAVWDPATGELSAPTGDDTAGSTAWFRPTVALTSLTVTTVRRQGSPTAYLWLAAQTAALAGILTDARSGDPEPVPGAVVDITGPDGASLPGAGGVPLEAITDESGAFEVDIFPVPVELVGAAADGATSIVDVLPEPVEADPSLYSYPSAVTVQVGAVPAVVPAAPQLPPTGLSPILALALAVTLGCAGVILTRIRLSGRRR